MHSQPAKHTITCQNRSQSHHKANLLYPLSIDIILPYPISSTTSHPQQAPRTPRYTLDHLTIRRRPRRPCPAPPGAPPVPPQTQTGLAQAAQGSSQAAAASARAVCSRTPSPRPLGGDGERRFVPGTSRPPRVFLLCAAALAGVVVVEVAVAVVVVVISEDEVPVSVLRTCLRPRRGTGSCEDDTATAAYSPPPSPPLPPLRAWEGVRG